MIVIGDTFAHINPKVVTENLNLADLDLAIGDGFIDHISMSTNGMTFAVAPKFENHMFKGLVLTAVPKEQAA